MPIARIEKFLSASLASPQESLHFSTHWWAGAWQKTLGTGEERLVLNPNRNTTLLRYTTSSTSLQQAIAAADSAMTGLQELAWGDKLQLIGQVGKNLRHYRTLLARSMQIEAGKPAWEAFAEVDTAIHHCEGIVENGAGLREAFYSAAKISAFSRNESVQLHPLGPCLAYLPFSTPVATCAVYFSSALLAGCPLVVVSSGHATLVSLIFAGLSEKLTLPPGSFNVVLGEFSDFRNASADKRIAGVLYIGSKEHGEQLQKDAVAQRKKQAIIQGGGKNTALVHSSADLDLAVKAVTFGVCKSTGQLPTSTSRVFVHEELRAEFCARIAASFQKITIGPCDDLSNGEKSGPLLGPLISVKSVERFLRFQTMARREAKITVQAGKKFHPTDSHSGFFVQPGIHLLDNFNPLSLYQSNLLFSPDLAIYSFTALGEVLETINRSGQAYSLAFFGEGRVLANQAQRVQTPNVLLNGPTVEMDTYLPFCSRSLLNQAPLWGIGIALSLCYPQLLREEHGAKDFLAGIPGLEP